MITVNCVGLGHWGPNLVRIFACHPLSRVGTVCDLSEDRLALVRRSVPSSFQQSRDALATVRDPAADAVVIATPPHTHFELAQAALKAGKHVFVEKPLCPTAGECAELQALAKKHDVRLCVGHVFLFNNGIRAVKNLIDNGELGEIRYIFSTRTNLGPIRSDVNALWDLAAHDVSIMNYWLKSPPVSVTAHGMAYLHPNVEDVVVANFVYPSKILSCVHASWLNPKKVREITVVGEQKMAVWNDMDLTEPLRIYNKSVDVQREPGYADTFAKFRMLVRSGDVLIPKIPGGEPLETECTHFLECIRDHVEPINNGENGLQVVRALEAADRSMRQNSALVSLDAKVSKPQPIAPATIFQMPSQPAIAPVDLKKRRAA